MNDLIAGLGRVLDVAAQRQQIIAGNMANIDTPGYRARDIDFATSLRQAITTPGDPTTLPVEEIAGALARPDGNDVSVERESLAMAQSQVTFHTATELLRAQFHLLSSAIEEK